MNSANTTPSACSTPYNTAVTPAQIDLGPAASGHLAEAKKQFQGALAGVAAAAIHLGHQAAAIGQGGGRLGADRRAAATVGPGGRRSSSREAPQCGQSLR